jgi:hypothetical protein
VAGDQVVEFAEIAEEEPVASSHSDADCFVEFDNFEMLCRLESCKLANNKLLVLLKFFLSMRVDVKDGFFITVEGNTPVSAASYSPRDFVGCSRQRDVKVSDFLDNFMFVGGGIVSTEDFVEVDICISNDLTPEVAGELGTIGTSEYTLLSGFDISEVISFEFKCES